MCDPIDRLYDKLTLHATKTACSNGIKRTISLMELPDQVAVLEDSATSDDMSRAFVGPYLPPYKTFVPIYAFRKACGHQ